MPGKAQSGFSVVEVLVAMLLLGVVLGGNLALQAASMRRAHEAYLHTQGMLLAADMASRLRVNAAAARRGAYLNAAAPFCSQQGAACRGHALARTELAQWRALLRDTLPQGAGEVSAADTAGAYRVRVHWFAAGGGGADCASLPPRHACSVFVVRP